MPRPRSRRAEASLPPAVRALVQLLSGSAPDPPLTESEQSALLELADRTHCTLLLPGGRIRVNEQIVSAGPGDYATFEGALKARFAKTNSKLVIIEGDRQAYLGSAIEIMDHARRAGAEIELALRRAKDIT